MRHCAYVLLALWLGLGWAHAAPQLDWGARSKLAQAVGDQPSLSEDIRRSWEATQVSQVALPNSQAHDPNQVWQWPAERFTGKLGSEPLDIRKHERLIARLTIFSEQLSSDFMLTVAQTRLDAMHVSYRYDGGAWITLSAGDTLPMARWPQPDKQPSFSLPVAAGQMDIVLEFAHRGILDAPVLLQNKRAFMGERAWSLWSAGVAVGIHALLALMGLVTALNFQRLGFLSITTMSTMMALALMFSTGLGGMFVGVDSARFNDESKFVLNTLWCVMLPISVSLALGMRNHSRAWWFASLASLIVGAVLSFVWADYDFRDTTPAGVPVILTILVVFSAAMLSWAWLKDYSRNALVVLGLALYAVTLILFFIGYIGLLSVDNALLWTAACSLLASMCVMRGLFLQHRLGRQVMARARISPLRDVLTGLLSREGMQAQLYALRNRIRTGNTCALWIYIQLIPAEDATDLYGEDGFEMGMVQVAASLSSAVSGSDSLARISRRAFAISVQMPADPALATSLAQKILSRLMALGLHGTPMASHVRLALAWLPLYSFRVDSLELRSLRALAELRPAKRIAWIGGQGSYAQAMQMLKEAERGDEASEPAPLGRNSDPQPQADSAQPINLQERIHRIEREMLQGVDTDFLIAEADRMSREINELNSGDSSSQNPPDDYEPTEFASRPALT